MIYCILLVFITYFAIYSVLLLKLMKFYKGLNNTNIEAPSKIGPYIFIKSADNFMKEAMTIHQDSSNNATVDQAYYWLDIDEYTPKASKIQLINKRDGVAMYGFLGKNKDLFTHWCPLPKFKE